MFDRYLWAGAVILAIGLLRDLPLPRPRAAAPSLAALALLGGLSLLVTVEE